jgi:hypothetical protein
MSKTRGSGLGAQYPCRRTKMIKAKSAKKIAITSVRYGRFSVLPMIASVAKSGPNVSPLSTPRRLASLMRARLTRLLTVPTAQ